MSKCIILDAVFPALLRFIQKGLKKELFFIMEEFLYFCRSFKKIT